MRQITVHDCYGNSHIVPVYNCNDFPITDLLKGAKFVHKRYDTYVNIPCAFDIETTSVKCDKPYGFMYHWQFCMGDTVCFGRTWEEYQRLITRLSNSLAFNPNCKYVVYVHNLSFEFQFMHNFIHITSLFARDKNKPMVVRTCEHIEYRCSWMLSNMSLDKFCKNSKGCIFWKKDGSAYDYEKFRLPITPLTPLEEEYCYCDVRGLCESIYSLLEDDDLGSIPMTSTGYIRREFRDVMKQNPENRRLFERLRLTKEQYNLCKEAFRGGNTSSNTLYVNEILSDVDSYDIQSSYPAAMLMDKFPMTKFMKVTINSREKFDRFINEKACLFRIICDDVIVKNMHTIPYIARAKCKKITGGRYGNGRVLAAKRIELVVTDIDWKIIQSHYEIKGGMVVPEMYIAEYDYLPLDFRTQLLSLFIRKCELKEQKEELERLGKEDSEEYKDVVYLYSKFKNRINAAYGMMVTDIASPEIIFEDGEWDSCDIDYDSALDNYYKSYNSFLSYQHGVWVTANARKRLQDMLDVVGRDCVYIDTDSIKCVGDYKELFARANELHYEKMKNVGLNIIVKIKDHTYYIGDWEYEGTYKRFKTIGSKKYIVEKENGKVELTLAGVNKEKGSKWFADRGGCDAFNKGVVLKPSVSGRTSAYYNTEPVHKIKFGECEFTTASNLALIPSTYELGITDEYQELIKEVKATA